MRDDIGTTTRDLRDLGLTNPAERNLHPDEREANTRRYGRMCRRSGITVIAVVFAVALVAANLAEDRVFHSPAAQALANLALFAALVAGSIVASAGFNERRERPLRAMMRHVLADGETRAAELAEIRAAIAAIAEHLPQALELQNWRGYTAAVREGFAGERTGTDEHPHAGPRPKPTHLGIVKRNDSHS